MLMPLRKTEVKQGLLNMGKGRVSDHKHTEIWVLSFTCIGGGISVKGGSYLDYLISGSFLNDINSKGDSTEVWRPGEGNHTPDG